MICFLDLDGVLVDFIEGALTVHGIKGTVEELYKNHPGNWNLHEILEMSDRDFWRPMDEHFWANLPWMHDGEAILEMVESRFGQENVVLLTSPASNPGCHEGKIRWMRRCLPRHYSRVTGHIFTGKKWYLSNPNHMLVDDHDNHIDMFASYNGGQVCQPPRMWNRLHEQCHKTLEVIAEILKL